MLTTILALFAVGTVAGFVDAIAGGGGLLTMPALWLVMGPVSPQLVLGTNKGQGVFGTAMSLSRFWRSPLLNRRRAAQSFVPALVGAAVGAWLVSRIDPAVLRPLVMAMLAGAAVVVIVQRPPSAQLAPRERPELLAIAVAFLLAGYDGFFGPGTGTFLILAYTLLWHDPLDAASANAKVVNFASNLASMISFAALGLIVWAYALPMAAGQLLGGWLGAHATLRGGRKLVRWVVVLVSLALMAKLARDFFWG